MRSASGIVALATALTLLAPAAPAAASPEPVDAHAGEVIVQEIAASGSRAVSGGFLELRNVADHAVDLSGWAVFRCDAEGLRAKSTRPEADLRDVVLQPGELFTIAHMSAGRIDADARFTQSWDPTGFGVALVAADGAVADHVNVYPNAPIPTDSECGPGANLPVTLAAALDESWQRTAGGEWVRARATPGNANVSAAALPREPEVRVAEIAAAGPAGHGDDFVEFVGAADHGVDVGGWRVYRCTARGVLSAETLQFVFPTGRMLSAGERFVLGGPGFGGTADATAATSLADARAGILLVDAAGDRVDGVTVSNDADTACQAGDAKLAATLDHRTGESWQRTVDGGFVIAARTPGERNAERARSVRVAAGAPEDGVAISEIATDPALPAPHGRRNYVELANFSTRAVDVSGWTLVACGADGYRRFDTLAQLPDDARLAPGETWTAALHGTPAALGADATYDAALEVAGAGAWLEDAEGRRVDSVGIYHRNEMDASNEQPSACTNGLGLSTFAVDRMRSETYQRVSFSGDDATDFAPAVATPGAPSAARSRDAATIVADAVARTPALPAPSNAEPASSHARPASASDALVHDAVAGVAPGPLTAWSAEGERTVDPGAALSRDDGFGHPYLRLTTAVAEGGSTVGWSGRTVGRAAVRLSVWNPRTKTWRGLDEATGDRVADAAGTAEEAVAVSGRVLGNEVVDGEATILVQSLPRTSSLDADPALGDPDDYDLALSHLTDTQYYTEAYPEVYASEVAWIAANAEARRIAFATHTGDLVQNWVDPDQEEDRARREFETASAMQAVLDDAGIPNSVLPGNHDNKRGITNDLFNEYFGPDRYLDEPWYGGSIAPDDNRASFSAFESAGARFLMLSLPYGYGEEEVAWAEAVVREHPDRNVVVSTHEHLTPKSRTDDAARSNSSRWLSHADLLWERVVAPHRNVVLVLSGHFHGLGAIVTEDAGGIAGHTVVEALADYQEFRTHTGERATGFQRLLQLDLSGSRLAVDTFSVPLGEPASHPYDYRQFAPVDGGESTPSNEQPWNIVAEGLQHRYTEGDDAFTVDLALQYAKAVETDGVWTAPLPARDR